MSAAKNRHNVNASFAVENVTDNVQDPDISAASKMLSGVLNYSYSVDEEKWRINSRLDFNQNELSHVLINRYGVGAGLQREIVPKKWSLGFDLSYYDARGTNTGNKTMSMRLMSPVKLSKLQRLDLSLMFLKRFQSKPAGSSPDFREFTGMVNYSFSF
jgi:hypothetical protein